MSLWPQLWRLEKVGMRRFMVRAFSFACDCDRAGQGWETVCKWADYEDVVSDSGRKVLPVMVVVRSRCVGPCSAWSIGFSLLVFQLWR